MIPTFHQLQSYATNIPAHMAVDDLEEKFYDSFAAACEAAEQKVITSFLLNNKENLKKNCHWVNMSLRHGELEGATPLWLAAALGLWEFVALAHELFPLSDLAAAPLRPYALFKFLGNEEKIDRCGTGTLALAIRAKKWTLAAKMAKNHSGGCFESEIDRATHRYPCFLMAMVQNQWQLANTILATTPHMEIDNRESWESKTPLDLALKANNHEAYTTATMLTFIGVGKCTTEKGACLALQGRIQTTFERIALALFTPWQNQKENPLYFFPHAIKTAIAVHVLYTDHPLLKIVPEALVAEKIGRAIEISNYQRGKRYIAVGCLQKLCDRHGVWQLMLKPPMKNNVIRMISEALMELHERRPETYYHASMRNQWRKTLGKGVVTLQSVITKPFVENALNTAINSDSQL